MEIRDLFARLGVGADNLGACTGLGGWIDDERGGRLTSFNPAIGDAIAAVWQASAATYDQVVETAVKAFRGWRMAPAPMRGQVVRDLGNALRAAQEPLGELVSLEMGKILVEGVGEVQEMIDICDFAVGLSRQLYGLTMHSERPGHRMFEQWHPLGAIGIITSFNFPVAVWAWNAAIAAICGDTMVWKPSSRTPLTAVAVQHIVNAVCADHGLNVARRLGRSILELGGNNAIIVTESADLEMSTRAILFGAVGTAGQRCTTTRRVIAHASVIDELARRLARAYGQVRIGDPREPGVLMGPLVTREAVDAMLAAVERAAADGGEVLYGGHALPELGAQFVEPTIIRMPAQTGVVRQETFAPILYLLSYDALGEAIALQNDVPQGLSSAIFTRELIPAETFLSHAGSDCGIANVNIGTSGAEIGGAFGGEKETGGGRESGSDAWKAYMWRQTCTINWSPKLPLAQGIVFGE